jgi:hypothetical protein
MSSPWRDAGRLPEPDSLTEAAEPLMVPHYRRIDPADQPEVLAASDGSQRLRFPSDQRDPSLGVRRSRIGAAVMPAAVSEPKSARQSAA